MLIVLILFASVLQAAEIPAEVATILRQPEFSAKYDIAVEVVPLLASADFDGDKLKDTVVAIRSRKTGRTGLAFVLQGQRRPCVIGADVSFSNTKALDPSVPLDEWKVVPKGQLTKLTGRTVLSRGDAIFVREKEAGSGIIYLTARGFYWLQLGD